MGMDPCVVVWCVFVWCACAVRCVCVCVRRGGEAGIRGRYAEAPPTSFTDGLFTKLSARVINGHMITGPLLSRHITAMHFGASGLRSKPLCGAGRLRTAFGERDV